MSTISLQPTAQPALRGTSPHDARVRHPQLRLTRRGRLVVFTAALLGVLALGLALMPGSSATDEPEQTETVLVGTGDTLWQIAEEVAEPGETGAMVDHLIELNGLESAMVRAGQELQIPTS